MPLARMFLVDASAEVRARLAQAFPDLEQEGAILTAARSDAVRRAEAERPDLILLTDSASPDLRSALASAKATSRIPVIVLANDAAGPAALAERIQTLFAEARLSSHLAYLEELGGKSFVQEMIELFLDTTPARILAARAGLAAGNHDALGRAVHSLKSAAANLGADELQELAGKIEHLATAGQGETLPLLMRNLEEAFARVETRLVRERDRLA